MFDKINNENFYYLENFIQLLEIISILCSPKILMQLLTYLKSLIPLYLETYANIFKSTSGDQFKFTPEQHLLVHYPRFIKIFVPLINFWTMRFEAKHRKCVTIPFTFAWKHKFRQSLEWIVSIENETECGRKKFIATSFFSFQV